MEIERKFKINGLPFSPEEYPRHEIEQGYLSTDPVVRVRKSDDEYYLTYKGKGHIAREEYNLPLTKESYEHLIAKADGNIITKTRYLIPEKDGLTIELDAFHGLFEGLWLAEVEFPSLEAAEAYIPPEWFGPDVSKDSTYHNATMSRKTFDL